MGKQNSRRSPAFAKLPRGRQSAATVPVALTIAGSDSSAGAGIQADLKTFSALGVYGLTAVTCVVAEIPGKVSRIEQVSARMVRDQVEVLAKNFQIGAIKTGLLCSAEIVSAVAKAIRGIESLRGRRIPLVIDPVMIASSGDRLLEAAAIDAYTDQLFPLATLITPNLDEAALLIGTEIKDRERMEKATKALASKYRAAILLKGGHLRGDNAIDLLFHQNKLTEFSARFVRGVATHGTGCTYSAAIAAGLASGLPLEKAIRRAKKFVTKSIVRHFRWKGKSGKIVALKQSI
ncbi:MAG: bifunctional hydroxymethylpyrimidine kinase/phosphomethylpyrimidine kinase [Verrucomicrobia bacterium]|nr:MAG: bifunctional hydroxymethylpyrimidine kinase/phosphomethylpyrimidine kinase [Verrucomicrobiota bacterium]